MVNSTFLLYFIAALNDQFSLLWPELNAQRDVQEPGI
jgi:hypothetical protein